MIASRRHFISGMGALLAAPAIVRYGSLMPVRGIVQPVPKARVVLGNFELCKIRDLLMPGLIEISGEVSDSFRFERLCSPFGGWRPAFFKDIW